MANTEYKVLKTITCESIYLAGDKDSEEFRKEFDSFLRLVRDGWGNRFFEELPIADCLIHLIRNYPKWEKFLISNGFIEKVEEEQWREITLRDLDKIREGVTLKREVEDCTTICHVHSEPFWTSWPSNPHILVFKCVADYNHRYGTHGEMPINDLFNGKVFLKT